MLKAFFLKNFVFWCTIRYSEFGDESTFLCLNVVLLAVFDALLIFMLFELEKTTKIEWQSVKNKLFEVLNKEKLSSTVRILEDGYGDYDVLFLQEVRSNFDEKLLSKYHVLFPKV